MDDDEGEVSDEDEASEINTEELKKAGVEPSTPGYADLEYVCTDVKIPSAKCCYSFTLSPLISPSIRLSLPPYPLSLPTHPLYPPSPLPPYPPSLPSLPPPSLPVLPSLMSLPHLRLLKRKQPRYSSATVHHRLRDLFYTM